MSEVVTSPAPASHLGQVSLLLRAEPASLHDWVARSPQDRVLFCVSAIAIGAGSYGAAIGCWRDALQALYTGIKLPLVIFLTTLGNGLLNGMLAPLLGLNFTFRQSMMAVLMTFAAMAVVLGAFSPLAVFVVWNLPSLTSATRLSSPEYGLLQLVHVGFMAFAGVTGNLCLAPLLRQWCGSGAITCKVLLTWLAVNLLLGSQVSWVLWPFIWDPARPVEFIGPEYFRGSFYETVFEAARRLLLG